MSRRVAARLRGCDAPSASSRPKPPALICGIMRGTSGAAGIQGEQSSGSVNVVRTGRSVFCCFCCGLRLGVTFQGLESRGRGKQPRVRDSDAFVGGAALGRWFEPHEGCSRAARRERESGCLRGFLRQEAPGLDCVRGLFDHPRPPTVAACCFFVFFVVVVFNPKLLKMYFKNTRV